MSSESVFSNAYHWYWKRVESYQCKHANLEASNSKFSQFKSHIERKWYKKTRVKPDFQSFWIYFPNWPKVINWFNLGKLYFFGIKTTSIDFFFFDFGNFILKWLAVRLIYVSDPNDRIPASNLYNFWHFSTGLDAKSGWTGYGSYYIYKRL